MRGLVTLGLAFLSFIGYAQKTLQAEVGDHIDLSIDNSRGELTWQVSSNNLDWNDMPEANNGALFYTIETLPVYLRLKIEEGTCNIHYSEILSVEPISSTPRILMFVSYEQTYYSEYRVMYETLSASGYDVDIRSSAVGTASIYTLSGDLNDPQNSVSGSDYTTFITTFQDLTGSQWNTAWNATPSFIDVDGRIQDVINMDSYEALVVVGGTGALDYRVDGTYTNQIGDGRSVSAADVQASAEKRFGGFPEHREPELNLLGTQF